MMAWKLKKKHRITQEAVTETDEGPFKLTLREVKYLTLGLIRVTFLNNLFTSITQVQKNKQPLNYYVVLRHSPDTGATLLS